MVPTSATKGCSFGLDDGQSSGRHLLSPEGFRFLNLEDDLCLVMIRVKRKAFSCVPHNPKSILFLTPGSRSVAGPQKIKSFPP